MLVAFMLYNDGIGTIIRMATLYGTQIGIDQGSLIGALLLVQFIGVPAAFLFGARGVEGRRQAGDPRRARALHGDQRARLPHEDGRRLHGRSPRWSAWCRAAARR